MSDPTLKTELNWNPIGAMTYLAGVLGQTNQLIGSLEEVRGQMALEGIDPLLVDAVTEIELSLAGSLGPIGAAMAHAKRGIEEQVRGMVPEATQQEKAS